MPGRIGVKRAVRAFAAGRNRLQDVRMPAGHAGQLDVDLVA